MGLIDNLTSNIPWLNKIWTGAKDLYREYKGINAAQEQQQAEQEWSHNEAELSRQYQTGEREASQQWNLEQWERENAYNDPSAQYSRLIAAGMNPATAMAALNGASNTAGQVVTSPMSGAMASNPGSIAGDMLNMIGNSANSFWQQQLMKGQVERQKIENSYLPTITEAEIKKRDAEINDLVASKKLKDEEANQIKTLLPGMVGKNEVDIKETEERINNLIEETKLTKERQKTEIKTQENIEADTANKYTTNAYIEEQRKGEYLENIKRQWEAEFRQDFGIDPSSSIGSQLIQAALNDKLGNVMTAIFQSLNAILGEKKEDGPFQLGPGGFKKGANWITKKVKDIFAPNSESTFWNKW